MPSLPEELSDTQTEDNRPTDPRQNKDQTISSGGGSDWLKTTEIPPPVFDEPRVVAEGLVTRDDRSITVKVDPEQQDELMRLRAQQDEALKGRTSRDVVVMFTDMVGSTAYYERHGDLAGRQKLLTHHSLLFPCIRGHGGTVIKTIGDGIMACFSEPRAALAAATEVLRRLETHNRTVAAADDAIHVRLGLNGGRALVEGGDLHGDVVNVAARIEAHAGPDEILLAESLLEGLGDLPVKALGAVALKGKREPIRLSRLRWREDTAPTPDDKHSLPSGLARRFRVVGVVGMGSAGITYLVVPKNGGEPAFVKVLYKFITRTEGARRRLLDQMWQNTRLGHPNIARVLEYSAEADERAFYLTEYVEGEDLRQRVERRGPLPVADVVRIGIGLAETLVYAHAQGAVHGDVKPGNVIISGDGGLKLTDFGLVRVWWHTPEQAAEPLSDPTFMAPQVVGGILTDARMDVYSLGALLYYLACGRAPIEGEATVATLRALVSGRAHPLSRVRPDLPRKFVAVIDRATAVVPNRRYATMAELRAALAELEDLDDTSPIPTAETPAVGGNKPTTEPTLVVAGPPLRHRDLLPPDWWKPPRPRWFWPAAVAVALIGSGVLITGIGRCLAPSPPPTNRISRP